jgi:hypothetical protein
MLVFKMTETINYNLKVRPIILATWKAEARRLLRDWWNGSSGRAPA